jgi:hypothetical protein
MKMRIAALFFLVVEGNLFVATSADADEKDSAELRSLREQVVAIQSRIEALIGRDTPSIAERDPSPAATNAAPAPMIPAAGSPGGIRYKGVSITLGGFVAAEDIYGQRNQGNDISTNFSAIPLNHNSSHSR